MYYLKYRPKTLKELDNSKVKELLISALSGKKMPHAFLFIGERGTGKTSVARIIAKAVNCLNNKFAQKSDSVDPCNSCKSCQLIDKDSSPDVLELDAASNRGIEEIKNLIKESFFTPMHSRYRVFIIDEAHMITQDAFNVLLKTLEEPSERVIFILATTAPEKIPNTIKSRCLIFQFSPVNKADIIHMLKRIIKAENLKIEEKALELIAEASDKSFRDAAKILEELVLLQKTEYEQIKNYLGIKDKNQFLKLILQNEAKTAIEWVENFYKQGGDIKVLLTQSLKELQEKLLFAVEKNEKKNIKKFVTLIKLLQDAYVQLKSSPIEVIPVELAIISFYNKFYDKSI